MQLENQELNLAEESIALEGQLIIQTYLQEENPCLGMVSVERILQCLSAYEQITSAQNRPRVQAAIIQFQDEKKNIQKKISKLQKDLRISYANLDEIKRQQDKYLIILIFLTTTWLTFLITAFSIYATVKETYLIYIGGFFSLLFIVFLVTVIIVCHVPYSYWDDYYQMKKKICLCEYELYILSYE